MSCQKLDGGDDALDATAFGVFYNYNFKAGTNMHPYLGAEYNMYGGDAGDTFDNSYGLVAGLKFYPWDNAGMNFGLRWASWQGADDNEDATQSQIFGGILIKF